MLVTDASRRFRVQLTIRARLTLWYSAVLFAVLIGAAIGVLSLHERLEVARVDEELIAAAHTVNGVLRNEFSERLTPLEAVHDMLEELDLPLTGVAVVDPAKGVLGSRMPGPLQLDQTLILAATETPKPPFLFKLLDAWPWARQFPARLIGMGVRPEHVRTPAR